MTNVVHGSKLPRPRGGAQPGERRGGRAKGTPNKFNADVKAAIIEAFHNAGGAAYLAKVAKDHPAVFCSLLGKVVPLALTGADGGALQVAGKLIVEFVKPKTDHDAP